MKFDPHPFLRNAHMMTILPALQKPSAAETIKNAQALLVDVAPDSKILVHYNPAPDPMSAPSVVLVHGLEGSSESPYLLNLAMKANSLGFNSVRVNLRNCGGTLHLSPTLYHAGMSGDIIALVEYLQREKNLSNIFIVGYSLGGNIVLKAAGELAQNAVGKIAGACAVSPSIDLNACIGAIETGWNRMYEFRFMGSLRAKVKAKAKLYPNRYDLSRLKLLNGLRSFDELFTAPDAGYQGALHYYTEASSLKVLEQICVPTLIIAAQDDPLVPFHSFLAPQVKTEYITLLSPEHGGHGGFINNKIEVNEHLKSRDRLWAENRILEFCLKTLGRG